MDLQTTFYIVAIVFMGVMLLLLIGLLVAVLAIKAKLNQFHRIIDEKVTTVRNLVTKLSIFLNTFRHFVKR